MLFPGMSLLVRGRETTAHQITNLAYTLLTHPQQLGLLQAGPELIPRPSRSCCGTSCWAVR
jgi:cytochrome P450